MKIHPSLALGLYLMAVAQLVGLQWASADGTERLSLSADDQLELTVQASGPVELAPPGARFRRPGPKGNDDLPASLTMAEYRGFHVRTAGGSAERHPFDGLFCYELKVAGATTYTWTVCDSLPLARFHLFNTAKGANYLAWVYTRSVCVAEVSKPRTRLDALRTPDHLGAEPGIDKVPVIQLLGLKRFPSYDALHCDIRIQSVDVDVKGRLTLKVSGAASPEVLTLVKEGGKWQLAEPAPASLKAVKRVRPPRKK